MRRLLIFLILPIAAGCTIHGPLSKRLYNLRFHGQKEEFMDEKRRDFNLRHPELSSEIQSSVLKKTIIRGMPPEAVIASWGKPNVWTGELAMEHLDRVSISSGPLGRMETWWFCPFGATYISSMTFVNGELSDWMEVRQ